MRNAVPILLLVLAAAAGWWLLSGADDELPPLVDEPAADARAAGGGESLTATHLEAKGLRVKGKTPRRKAPRIVKVDPRTLPKGVLLVTILGPDLEPMDSGPLRVFVEPGKRGVWTTKLPVGYDKETRTHRFDRVVAGPVRVRIEGDHIIARTVDAVVKRDRENMLSVTLDLAGAIRYDVMKYDKKRPEKVKLTLYDYRDQPVLAWYQERTTRRMTSPRQLKTAEIGPEGVVYGILPGRYRLRVESPAEEWDEAEVDIVAGKTAKVSLEVRR